MQKTIRMAAILSFLFCMAAGYSYIVWKEQPKREAAQARIISPETGTKAVLQKAPQITADTKLIYQYYYTEDRVTKEQTEAAPFFLQGLTLSQLQTIYNGWQILSFSEEKVILRSQIHGRSDETYIIGEDDGYLAVFYEDTAKEIHLQERTDVPLSALAETDALQIREGLRVTGEENLVKLLSDYMS